MTRAGAVIVAAGRAERMAGLEKMLVPLGGRPLLEHSLRAFETSGAVFEIVVVTREDLLDRVRRLIERGGFQKVRAVVPGGETRVESSRHGLSALSKEIDVVLVHDGARPLVSTALIERVASAASESGAVVPAVPPSATIKEIREDRMGATLDRSSLREAQTPQGFRRSLLAKAFAKAARGGPPATDDAALVERIGEPVSLVEGERRNLKVTVPDDLALAEALLSGGSLPRQTRIGVGFDVHRLVEGRPLVLGGVEIPHPKGLEGHSDADVLAHAVCDALLGAAAAGDLGEHFPDTDERWRGVSGRELLTRTVEILRELGYVAVNVDVTVQAQAPKLAPYRTRMLSNLAGALRVPETAVSVKFTTTEGLGFEGRGEGISAAAVVLVGRIPLLPESQ